LRVLLILKSNAMKRKNKLLICIFSLVLLNLVSTAQEKTGDKQRDSELKEIAREIMKEAEFCSLITIDDQGRPRARTMDPYIPEDNFIIWFVTKATTRKVKQIRNNPLATVYYYHDESFGYVSLYGKAYLIDDSESKTKWWKNDWDQFYPDGREAALLIKFVPEWLELYSSVHKTGANPETWAPPVVTFPQNK